MKHLPYILKHLRKNWIRTSSTIAAMALCVFLIATLQTVLAAFYGTLDTAATDRLITRHRVSLTESLPLSHEPRIAAIAGVKRVAKTNWFGGVLGMSGGQPDMKNFFANFAVDAEPYLEINPEYGLTAADKQAFMQDMRGAIIGPDLAEKFGWKIGSTFQLESMIPPYRADTPFEFVVRAIYTVDTQKYPNHARDTMLFHWKYLYEKTAQRASVGTYTLKIANASQAPAIAKAVDAIFENSDNQTKTETEAQFVASFIALIGDLGLILNAIAMAVAFTILLVTANTMSMAIRERRKEIAVLKTLGFPSALVLALVLGEALVIGLLGSGLGVLMAVALIGNLGSIPGLQGFGSVAMSAGLSAAMFGVGAAMGLISGLAPAVGAYRANITSMLRQV